MTTKSLTAKSLKQMEKITGGSLTLGKLIGAIRQADELSQVIFAKKLGISRQHLCDIEHDRKVVSPQLAAKYAKILGYSAEQFVRLALQAMLDKAGLGWRIELKHKSKGQAA